MRPSAEAEYKPGGMEGIQSIGIRFMLFFLGWRFGLVSREKRCLLGWNVFRDSTRGVFLRWLGMCLCVGLSLGVGGFV